MFYGQLLACWLKQPVALFIGLITNELVLQHVVEPVLDPGQVVGVIHVGFRQRDVADKVLEDGFLFIH